MGGKKSLGLLSTWQPWGNYVKRETKFIIIIFFKKKILKIKKK